jgi:Mce-associated membrane protein
MNDQQTTEQPTTEPSWRRLILPVSAAAVVLSLAFAVISGVFWWRAGHDATATAAAGRDTALQSARKAITTALSIDSTKFEESMNGALDVTSGELNDQFRNLRDAIKAQMSQAPKSIAQATITDAALIEFDNGKGTAKAIAVVKLTVTKEGGQPAAEKKPLAVDLLRTDSGWKLTSLAPVSQTSF